MRISSCLQCCRARLRSCVTGKESDDVHAFNAVMSFVIDFAFRSQPKHLDLALGLSLSLLVSSHAPFQEYTA